MKSQFDHARPFAEQACELLDQVPLTSAEWQGRPLVVCPPSLAVLACTLLAELHGRMGYFPPAVRLRPMPDRVPPQFEVAEIINLQALERSGEGEKMNPRFTR